MSTAKAWEDRIGRRLKLRDLHVLLTVAQCGSMGKAAAQLAVSQPAISKAIADMEYTLQVRLLDRTVQGIVPTPYGSALLKWGLAVFDDLRQAVKEIEFLSDATAGEVRIGSTEAMTAGLVPAVIDHVARRYPRIVFHVAQAPTIALQYRDLRERRVDVVLGRMLEPTGDDDVNAEVLFDDPLLVVAGANSPWHRRRRIEPGMLVDAPWCLSPRDSFARSRAVDGFRAIGLNAPKLVVESTSIQLFIALLATGRFLSLLSASTLRFSGKRLGVKALPVDLAIEPGPVGILTLTNRTLGPVAGLFIAAAREVAQEAVGAGARVKPAQPGAQRRARR
jgi:DNA-binding transcriptional LysR family regulator